MTALDWAAKIVEENGQELAESFLKAARDGDWRAAEALMSRIFGKPQERVEHLDRESETERELKSMTREQRTAWLIQLEQRGELRLAAGGEET